MTRRLRRLGAILAALATVALISAAPTADATSRHGLHWFENGCSGQRGCLWFAIDGFDPEGQQEGMPPTITYGDSFTLHWQWRDGAKPGFIALTANSERIEDQDYDRAWRGQPLELQGVATIMPPSIGEWDYGANVSRGVGSIPAGGFYAAVVVCTPDGDCW